MFFRKINNTDLEIYNKINNTVITKEYFNNFINNILNKFHNIYVLEQKKNIIGFGTLILEHKLTHNGCIMAHIENIIIDENYRKQGYGNILIKELIEICKKEKCYKIILNCDSNLEKFYKKNNFTSNKLSMELLIKENF
tara:strand:+ start:902 stop:1318 length:417 start_codon:yes stop_codon:yes gene_type:complete